jgi:hypothetical protein
MKRKMMAKVLMLLGTFGAGSAQEAVFHFDFDDLDAPNTAPGYTSVVRTSIYSGGIGWGLVELDSGAGSGFGDINQSAVTVTGGDLRYSDAVEFKDAGDLFRVDLPNGDYNVTVALGVPGYNSWNKVDIQGVNYHWNSDNVNNITAPSPDNAGQSRAVLSYHNLAIALRLPSR